MSKPTEEAQEPTQVKASTGTLGWGDQTLQDMLQRRDKLTEDHEHYYGLEELQLANEDPIQYDRAYTAIHDAARSARQTARNVAASPGARELGELLFGVLTPEGDTVAVSRGLIGHQGAFPISIQHMIENGYEDNPGFEEGDIFTAFDPPTTGTPHAGDTYTFCPIIYEGELVGWAAACNHIMETGPAVAAAWPPWSPNTYTDGFLLPPTQVGEDWEDWEWFYEAYRRRTRAPVFNILDQKMRVSGNKMINDRIIDIIEEFGLEYYKRVIREIIDDSARAMKRNIQDYTFPGKSNYVAFQSLYQEGLAPLFEYADRDWIFHLAPEDHIDTVEGEIHIDFKELSPADWHASGGYEGHVECNLWLNVMDTVGMGLRPNRGFNMQIDYDLPKGSMYNPKNDEYSAGNPWAAGVPLFNAFGAGVEHSKFARGYLEEAWNEDVGWTGFQGEIVRKDGSREGFSEMDLLGASSTPASNHRDGEPVSTAWWNPESDTGSAEEWEYVLPGLYYFSRTVMPNYFGPGKHHGGNGIQIGYFITDDIKEAVLGKVGGQSSEFTTMASLPGGGYPAPTATLFVFRDTNILELLDDEQMPGGLDELKEWIDDEKLTFESEEIYKEQVAAVTLKPGDLYFWTGNCSGGWGDPLEREWEDIEHDLRHEFVTPEAVQRLHGVVVEREDGEWQMDEEATEEKRTEMLEQRSEDAIEFKDWWQDSREDLDDLPPLVEQTYDDLREFSEDFDERFSAYWALNTETGGDGDE